MISVRHVGHDQCWIGVEHGRAFVVAPSGERLDVVEGQPIEVRPQHRCYLDRLLADLPHLAPCVVVTDWPPPGTLPRDRRGSWSWRPGVGIG